MDIKDPHRNYEKIPRKLNDLGREIVDAAFKVHKSLGPGLLEKIYEVCLCHELSKKGISSVRQKDIPIRYDGLIFDEGLRLDILVENEIICELKAVDEVNPVWEAQILSHLKLLDKRLGYLINFNVRNIGRGIKRFAL
ncbi:MAG TPA: GxxExxY protein [Balneolaceae bacterium]|nr:GxxExxY protein [Balneolaceae bacterium]